MRILIATATAGAGHLQAAAALEEAWKSLPRKDVIRRVDVLDFGSKLTKKFYAQSYMTVAQHVPELYAYLFKKTDSVDWISRVGKLRRTMAARTSVRFHEYLRRIRPRAVVCTHYLPLELIGGLRDGNKPFTVSVITDFEAHALWMEPCVDLYCVAVEETRARLLARGVPADRIVVTGIPVAAKFQAKADAAATRRALDLRNDLPTLLVLSGGFGMGPVEEILNEINKLARSVQVVVVAGKNKDLFEKLNALKHRHTTRVLGFVTNMNELMGAADLILSKPGGLTTSEALAIGKPLLILNPIPGQEAANSDFLLENGAASKANRVEDLPYKLEQLLAGDRIAKLAARAKALGQPHAARAVCEEVVRRLESAS